MRLLVVTPSTMRGRPKVNVPSICKVDGAGVCLSSCGNASSSGVNALICICPHTGRYTPGDTSNALRCPKDHTILDEFSETCRRLRKNWVSWQLVTFASVCGEKRRDTRNTAATLNTPRPFPLSLILSFSLTLRLSPSFSLSICLTLFH